MLSLLSKVFLFAIINYVVIVSISTIVTKIAIVLSAFTTSATNSAVCPLHSGRLISPSAWSLVLVCDVLCCFVLVIDAHVFVKSSLL